MKHLFLCCAILASLLVSHTISAQKYYEKFLELGFIIQQGDKILPTPEGNYILSGSSIADTSLVWHEFVTKLTPEGDTLWLTQIPCSEGYLYFGDMIATEYGYAVVATRFITIVPYEQYEGTIVFIQIDEHGNILNQQDVGILTDYNVATKIIRTDDNGYLITGYAIPEGNYYYMPYSLKLSPSLGTVWENYYEGFNQFPETLYPLADNPPLYAVVRDIVTNTDGTYYLWGVSIEDIKGAIFLIQIDAQGNHIWDTMYHPSGWTNTVRDDIISAKRTKDKGYITTARYGGTIWNPKYMGVFMKFDSSLNYLWKSENLFNSTAASAVFELADGSFVAGGCHEDTNDDWQVRIAKVNSAGGTVWKRTYGTPENDYAYDMIQTHDGGYLLCGRSYFPAQNIVPLYLIKTNCMGLLTEPQANFTRTQTDLSATFQNLSQFVYPDSIDGGHYLWQFGDGTTSTEINPTHTYATAGEYSVTLTAVVCSDTSSYTEVVGVWATGIASPLPPPKEGEVWVFPNPTRSNWYANYQLPTDQTAQLSLYDINGRMLQQHTLIGSGQLSIDTQNLYPGLYYYTISIAGTIVKQHKIVLIK